MEENRIKVTEIIEEMKKGNDSILNKIKIQDYVPVSTKRLICEEITRNSIVEKDGIKIEDSITYEIAKDLTIIEFYTNLDIEEYYDDACKYGIIDFIKDNMNQNEYDFILEHSSYMIQNEIETYNSLAGIISRNLQQLIDKLPDEKGFAKLVKSTIKEINKINPEKFKYVNDMINSLQDKVN